MLPTSEVCGSSAQYTEATVYTYNMCVCHTTLQYYMHIQLCNMGHLFSHCITVYIAWVDAFKQCHAHVHVHCVDNATDKHLVISYMAVVESEQSNATS